MRYFNGYPFAITLGFITARRTSRRLSRSKPRRDPRIRVRRNLSDVAGRRGAASKQQGKEGCSFHCVRTLDKSRDWLRPTSRLPRQQLFGSFVAQVNRVISSAIVRFVIRTTVPTLSCIFRLEFAGRNPTKIDEGRSGVANAPQWLCFPIPSTSWALSI
jgi:hypothetical protein